MPLLTLQFDEDLAGLLRAPHRRGRVQCPSGRRASVKDIIESLGVPHTEVYGIRSDGVEAAFGHIPEPGQMLEIDGAHPPVDPLRGTLLRSALPQLRFLVDENVAKLAQFLRALGFDTLRDRRLDDAGLARAAMTEGRFVLSRDRALLKRSAVAHGRLLRSASPLGQLAEVAELFGLARAPAPFSRCLRCNEELVPVDKAAIIDRLEPRTRLYYDRFCTCASCGRLYWQGSHHGHMCRVFAGLGLALEPDGRP